MYRDFFGLSADPFSPAPDPRFFFESHTHRRALAYLRYGIAQEEGSVIITGARGMGKTLLLRRLARALRARSATVVDVPVPPSGVDDLVREVARRLGLAEGPMPTRRLHGAIRGHLLTLRQAGRRAFLVLDEVHNLPALALLQLQDLVGQRTGSRYLFPGLLLGDVDFRETLQHPDFRSLRQATAAAYQLSPLSLEETMDYIEHRLRLAGWRGDNPRFAPLAFMEAHFLGMGVPGRISRLCDRSLAIAAEQGLAEVKAETVNTAAALLPGEPETEGESPW